MSTRADTTTAIATSTTDDVFIRGESLCQGLVGHVTFTEMIVFQMLGWRPTPAQTRLVDACLVTLMEHGMTPSALAARLVYGSAPEALQAGVAAGLLAVGSRFAGTTEAAGALLARLVAAGSTEAEADTIVAEHRARKEPVPGFGHPQHKPDDPRAIRLVELARADGVAGAHVEALIALARAVDRAAGKHITINATGAIAAVLADLGVPASILRGFALIARAAGLVGHLHEEQRRPAMRAIWEAGDRAVPYDGEPVG
ncbi:MAG: citryl-CoA lyase [Deltaproteobacteria bacterium]|nr:citryl-CoA lyase [Deltaproteobacteria bacterium]